MFKITAQEKKLILERRKVQAQPEAVVADIRKLCKKYTDFLEGAEFYDDIETIADDLEDPEVTLDLEPELSKAIEIIYGLQSKLVEVLNRVAMKQEARYKRLGNKIVVRLGF